MGRICKICNSEHREEYDKLRLEGHTIKEILELAHSKYGETDLSYHNFRKHFANHVQTLISETVKASKLRDKVVRETIKRDIEVVKTFSRNLQLVTNKIETITDNIENIEDLKKYGKLFLSFLGEARLTIDQYLKFSNKLEIQDTSDDLFRKMMACMHDFPPDLLGKFADRWEKANAKD